MLSVRNLVKSYPVHGGAAVRNAVDGVSFEVAKGEFFTLLGPSGCGKTTTLQCLAGLETPTSGTIEMDGRAVFSSDRRVMVPANKRNLGMVFQSYAIWPHLSVADNVAFPLLHTGQKISSTDLRRRVMQALDLVKLAAFADRPSPMLSGGQQQRVALARALVHEPRVLLLDEPLSNLDAKLRDVMRVEIRALVTSLGITTIFVTHDQLEAMSMSDSIVLMRDGRIVQHGAPRDVYLRPTTAFTADFMGRSNLIPARKLAGSAVSTSFGEVACEIAGALLDGAAASLVIRPHALEVQSGEPQPGPNRFRATILSQSFLGDLVEADLDIGGQVVRAALNPYVLVPDGGTVDVIFPPERCIAVPTANG